MSAGPAQAGRPAGWLAPEWGRHRVGALMSTREGGVSAGPYASLNLGDAVGDAPHAVAENRARFAAACAATPVFLRQVHGTTVLRLGAADTAAARTASCAEAAVAAVPVEAHRADASFTTEPGIACTVLVADCLPVLFAAPDGRGVAAAHAGWRGLAAGVLEATVASLCQAAGCAPASLEAWLGPCIGASAFEVGADVLQAFGADPTAPSPRFAPATPGKWLADLPGLARDRLAAAGVTRVSGGEWCAASDASRFFSFRRDGVTGRMGAAVWIEGRGPTG